MYSRKYDKSGIGSNPKAKEAIQTAFNYFKANAKSVSQGIPIKERDYHLHVQDLTGVGMSDDLALAAFLSLCSGVLEKPVQEQTAILGTITIGGSISNIDNLSDLLQERYAHLMLVSTRRK
jgi:ATP-dependent Lon protease